MTTEFKIFCEPNQPFHYYVEVHDSPASLWASIMSVDDKQKLDPDQRAACFRYVKDQYRGNRKVGTSPECGRIFFLKASFFIR